MGTDTIGCKSDIKHSVEKTFWHVNSVVDRACTPPAEPEPSMQCRFEGQGDVEGCDVAGAISCMYGLYSSLECDKPDWASICP